MSTQEHQWHITCLKSLLVLNLFDAICTYIWVTLGYAEEANPLMDYIISIHPPSFILYKVIMVSLGVLLLWRLREKLFCRIATIPATIVYAAVGVIHTGFIINLCFTTACS